MAVHPAPDLPVGDDLPELTDDYTPDEWYPWHDEFVTELGKRDGREYLTLVDDIADDAVLIDRRGVFYTKSWDGQDVFDKHEPDMWTWNALTPTLQGVDPENFIMLGSELGIEHWTELINMDTMPLRIATEDEIAGGVRRKFLIRDAALGPGGTPRGKVMVCDTMDEAREVARRTWTAEEV